VQPRVRRLIRRRNILLYYYKCKFCKTVRNGARWRFSDGREISRRRGRVAFFRHAKLIKHPRRSTRGKTGSFELLPRDRVANGSSGTRWPKETRYVFSKRVYFVFSTHFRDGVTTLLGGFKRLKNKNNNLIPNTNKMKRRRC